MLNLIFIPWIRTIMRVRLNSRTLIQKLLQNMISVTLLMNCISLLIGEWFIHLNTMQIQSKLDNLRTNQSTSSRHKSCRFFYQLCEGVDAVAVGKDLCDVFASETNWCADKYLSEYQDIMKAFSKATKWQLTSREEMRAFVGLLLNTRLVCKATTELWFCEKYFSQQTSGFKIMSLDRFKLLLHFFHVSDFVDKEAPSVGTQNVHVSWSKDFHCKQSSKSTKGQLYNVYMQLLKAENWSKNHHLRVDNYYTSVALCEDVYQQGVYVIGTVRANWVGLPVGIKQKGHLYAQCWYERPLHAGNFYDTGIVFGCSPLFVLQRQTRQVMVTIRDDLTERIMVMSPWPCFFGPPCSFACSSQLCH